MTDVATDIEDEQEMDGLEPPLDERCLRLIVESLSGMVLINDARGAVEYANPRLLEFLGVDLEYLGGDGWTRVIHPDDLDTVQRSRRERLATGASSVVLYRARRFDGVYRWLEGRAQALRLEDGRICRWCVLFIDVDDRKRAEDALRDSERRLRQLFETLPVEIWCARPDGELSYINPRMAGYIGMEIGALTFSSWYQIVHPQDRAAMEQRWMHSVRTGDSFASLHRVRRHDGSYRWCQTVAEPLRDETGRVTQWYGSQIDVEEQKRVEETLRVTREHLAHSARLATVAELSATIAHEVNQPLASVVAHGHACQSWLSSTPPNIERAMLAASRVVRDGNAAADVVKRTRALFQKTPPSKAALDINDLIGEVLHLMMDEIRARGVVVRMELEPSLPLLQADRTQIQQVVLNLAHNAIEAMSETITHPRLLLLRSRCEPPDRVVVEVCDDGAGVADLERIFEPFYTTKPQGMGMGLTVCRSIIEAHGGHLGARSGPGPGTTFSFTLPLAAADVALHGRTLPGSVRAPSSRNM